MRVMLLTDVFPYPPHQGSAVISYHWIRGLASNNAIWLLSLEPPCDEGALGELRNVGVTVLNGVLPSKERSFSILGELSSVPMAFKRIDARLLRRRVLGYLRATCIDVVVIVGPVLAALLVTREAWPCPVLMVPFDSVSFNLRARLHFLLKPGNWKIARAIGENPARLIHYCAEALKWERIERDVYPRADGCVAVTPVDAAAIARQWSAELRERIHIIPIGVDTRYYQPIQTLVRERSLVFSGRIGSVESAASALWFIERVFPKIRRFMPDVSLEIVGKDPPAIVRKRAASISGVHVTGFVPDIRPFLAAAAVYVSPILLGSGMKTRILEALAMGKAVVATAESCRGLNVEPGKAILIAEDPDSFQHAIIALLQNPGRRAALGHAGREFVEAFHSWELITQQVHTLLENLRQSFMSRLLPHQALGRTGW